MPVRGVCIVRKGRPVLTAEKQVEILKRMEESGDFLGVKAEFGLTLREMKLVLMGGKWRRKKAAHSEARSLRERLYERAVGAVEQSLAPIAEVIENNPLLLEEKGMEHLPTVVGHLKNSGQTAVKVLEGLGDFRRGGDEVTRDVPRQPLFNLPAGSHVAVTVEISTGQVVETRHITELSTGGNDGDGSIERDGGEPAARATAEDNVSTIGEGEPAGAEAVGPTV